MNFFFSRRTQLTVASCALLLFFLSVAFPTGYFFLNDDFIHVPLAGGGSFLNRSFVRPVSDITLYIDHWLWQKNAAGYHLTNIVLHLACTVSLFLLASKLFRWFSPVQGFDGRPWLAAFLFMVNGCQTESVFWIIGRGGSLAALFAMLSLVCFLNKERSKWWVAGAFLFFIMGLFAYEAILPLPFIVQAIHYARVKTDERQHPVSFTVIGYWVMVPAYFVYRVITDAPLNAYEQAGLQDWDLVNRLYNLNTLLARSFVPPAGSRVLLAVYILLMLLSVVAVAGLIKRPQNLLLLRVLFFCVFAAVVPFVGFGADTHDSESGRFIYFSSAIACIFIVELLTVLVRRNNLRMAIACLLLLVHAWFFFSTAKDYRLAGQVVKQSLACLRGATGEVHLVNVPTQYRGALIFRSGLPEAMQWYNNDKVQVNIINSKEIAAVKRLSCEAGPALTGAEWSGIERMAYYWTDSSIVRIQP
jgi:NADH:ubiquinone oxidoreductase subunit K